MQVSAYYILALPLLCVGVVAILLLVWVSQTMFESGRKHESWPAFANDISGKFVPATAIAPDNIEAQIAGWPLHIDTCVIGGKNRLITYTRIRAFYRSRQRLELVLYTADMNHAQIDATRLPIVECELTTRRGKLIARTNNEALANRFLADPAIQTSLALSSSLDFRVYRRRNWHNGGISNSIYEVHLLKEGVITERNELNLQYDLVTACLQRLSDIDVAEKAFTAES